MQLHRTFVDDMGGLLPATSSNGQFGSMTASVSPELPCSLARLAMSQPMRWLFARLLADF